MFDADNHLGLFKTNKNLIKEKSFAIREYVASKIHLFMVQRYT